MRHFIVSTQCIKTPVINHTVFCHLVCFFPLFLLFPDGTNTMQTVPRIGDAEAPRSTSSTWTNLKIIVLGDKCVGKTTLINALIDEDSMLASGRFFTMGSVSSDVVPYTMETVEYGTVHLNIWDTVGEDYTEVIPNNIFRGANGIIILYDVSNRDSFVRVSERWLPRIRAVIGEGGLGDDRDVSEIMMRDHVFKILIVANKIDIVGTRRVVSDEEARALTNRYKLPFIGLSTISDKHDSIMLPFMILTRELAPFFATPNSTRARSPLMPHATPSTKYRDDSTACC